MGNLRFSVFGQKDSESCQLRKNKYLMCAYIKKRIRRAEQMRQMSQITMMSSITTKHENDCGKEEPWISSRREKKKPQGG
jgi:hypothetical protein